MPRVQCGLDGWHVCGVDNQLFYSQTPVLKTSETESIKIEKASPHFWSSELWSAHKKVRSELVSDACKGWW